jgi:hypothetical protein
VGTEGQQEPAGSCQALPEKGSQSVRKIGVALLSVLTAAVIAVALSGTARADASNVALFNYWTLACADLPGFGADPVNTPVEQYDCNFGRGDNQLWNIQQTGTAAGFATYKIVNVKSGLCLDPPGFGSNPAGTHLATFTCASTPANDNQEWWINSVRWDSHQNTQAYTIVNRKSGLCLDVAGWARNSTDLANNQALTLYTCSDSSWDNEGYDDHLWDLIPA